MINFIDELIDFDSIKEESLFICSVGYEERSYFLLEKFKEKVPLENILVFAFKEYVSKTNKDGRIEREDWTGIKVIEAQYDQSDLFYEEVITHITSQIDLVEDINIYIDYSYMPRLWYCGLPLFLRENLSTNNKIVFLYAEGIYLSDYQRYPTAGIKSLNHFSGISSLRFDLKRTHVIALSYDVIRTEGLLSMLDPDSFVVCNAYDSSDKSIHESVLELNESILTRANMAVSLHMDKFSFMIAKLCEIANEYLTMGDVVIIPDGPKPLIFALSLVPDLLNKEGVTCLHVLRNNEEDNPTEVEANHRVIGFSINWN